MEGPVAVPAAKKALIVWSPSKHRRALYKIVAATGASVDFAEGPEPELQDHGYSLIVVDSDEPDGRIQALLKSISKLEVRPAVLAITSSASRSHLASLLEVEGLTNLFVKNVDLDATELVVTVQKILRRDIFGLEKYLTWGVQPHEFTVTNSHQKHEIIGQLTSYLSELGCNSRLARLAQGVADELLMNAVYNAPVENGIPRYAARPRTERVALEEHEYALFRYACDGRNLALSVSDPFGYLSRETVLSYLRRCFAGGEGQIKRNTGGSGLGLFYIFESLNHFIVNVAPGTRTEMIGVMNIAGSYREFAEHPKSIHLFYETGGA